MSKSKRLLLRLFFHIVKMEIPLDSIRYEAIKYLTVQEILQLCKTRKEYQEICSSDTLWYYLVERFQDQIRWRQCF